MPFYSDIDVNVRERVALDPGSYGTGKEAGLKVLSYISVKDNKAGHQDHSFLVAATQPSQEAKKKALSSNGNKTKVFTGQAGAWIETNPLDTPDFKGTAFMRVTLDQYWITPEAVAMAFTEVSRNQNGDIQKDHVTAALEAGEVTEGDLEACSAYFRTTAQTKVLAANTPEDKLEQAIEDQYRKELQQISIKVGQFFTLQDWKNDGDKSKRNLDLDPMELVGVEFSGKVEHDDFGNGGSKVTSIYSFNAKR